VDISTPTRPLPVGELEDLHAEVARLCGREGMACVLGIETPLAADPQRGKPYNSALVISETGAILGPTTKRSWPPSTRWPTRREGRSRRSTCSA